MSTVNVNDQLYAVGKDTVSTRTRVQKIEGGATQGTLMGGTTNGTFPGVSHLDPDGGSGFTPPFFSPGVYPFRAREQDTRSIVKPAP